MKAIYIWDFFVAMNRSILQVVVAIQHNHKPFYVFKSEGNRDFTAQVREKS